MKVVISCEGGTLESRVDPRFGRCQTFLLADTETLEVEAVPNEAAVQGGGAGIQAAQLVVNRGAEAVITGQLGPNAAQVLESAGIPVYIGAQGTAREALEAFKANRLSRAQGATVAAHFGLGGGGGGMGRGMGIGRGQGMNRGMQGSAGLEPSSATSVSGDRPADLAELKRMHGELQRQMSEIQRRIEELEKE